MKAAQKVVGERNLDLMVREGFLEKVNPKLEL